MENDRMTEDNIFISKRSTHKEEKKEIFDNENCQPFRPRIGSRTKKIIDAANILTK